MLLIKSLTTVILIKIVSCHPLTIWRDHRKDFSYLRRADWNASPPKDIIASSYKPVLMIVVKHTNTPYCHRKLACAKSVKKLQHQSMASGSNDIQYSFLIDPHGNVYEGLGWFDLQTDQFDQAYRTIGLIGLENSKLTIKQREAIANLLELVLDLNILNKQFQLCSTPDMVQIMKNVKIELEMDMDDVNSIDITESELLDLKKDLSITWIECVMKTNEEQYDSNEFF